MKAAIAFAVIIITSGCSDLEVGTVYEMTDGHGTCVRLFEDNSHHGSRIIYIGNPDGEGDVLITTLYDLRRTPRCDAHEKKLSRGY